MPFGVSGALTHFQQTINRIIWRFDWTTIAYIDNILVISNIEQNHIQYINEVISEMTKVGFQLNMKKCRVGYKKIKFIGFLIDSKSQRLDEAKVTLFQELFTPKRRKDVESLLGFANYLRNYIPLYANIVVPLETLWKKRWITPQDWSEEYEKAFT
jgi:isocitrate/isopropylmalate dehydrogenase